MSANPVTHMEGSRMKWRLYLITARYVYWTRDAGGHAIYNVTETADSRPHPERGGYYFLGPLRALKNDRSLILAGPFETPLPECAACGITGDEMGTELQIAPGGARYCEFHLPRGEQ